MRVTCPHCQQKAIITSSNQLSSAVKDLYCQCMNTKDCGASFVFVLAYKHDLNPPQKSARQIAASLIMNLSSAERQQLQADVFN
ncbi:MAG: ogr/Delta-like zinc finger family protein [Methylomicrobium sp.]